MSPITSHALDVFTQLRKNILKSIKRNPMFVQHRKDYFEVLLEKCDEFVGFLGKHDEAGGIMAMNVYLSSMLNGVEMEVFNEHSGLLNLVKNVSELRMLDDLRGKTLQ